MKLTTLALASAFALSSTLALAYTHQRSGVRTHHGTVGMSSGRTHRNTNAGNPNGTAGGPTSLSGTGSSQFGGASPGTAGRN
jgi:hypothetical protein